MNPSERYQFGDGSEYPLYLTNGCCEATHSYVPDIFGALGIPAGTFDGGFYPLTDTESRFIGDDMIDVADGFGALTGYSALYAGEKFLMPSIEVYFGEGGSEVATAAFGQALAEEYRERIEAIGGHVFFKELDQDDRHLIQVLIPFAYAASHAANFVEWKRHLETDLLRTDLKVAAAPSAATAP